MDLRLPRLGRTSGAVPSRTLWAFAVVVPALFAVAALTLEGQNPPPAPAPDAAAGAAAAADAAKTAIAIDPGHTAWMLVSTALVLLMTPGLALFYGGMVRQKNVLGTIMHSMFAMGLITILWVTVGYTIAFGDDTAGGLWGQFNFAFLKGVDYDAVKPGTTSPYPHIAFMAFQMMFAIITPALITGAFAERVKFRAYVVFMALWSLLVYCPLAHWVWGGGILSGTDVSWAKKLFGVGAIDFAGGTVVHISSGVSALVFCLLIGKRKGYPATPMKPNNLVLTMAGAGILWFGWFGFNGGSELASDGTAALAFVVTHICAASAAFSWAVVERFHRGKASALGVASGLVAGLVCITPASGFVEPMPALIMGLIVSPICYFFVAVLKAKLGYDDSLDAFGIHGIGGTLGAMLTGVFANEGLARVLNGLKAEEPFVRSQQLGAQALATVVTWVFAAVMTLILVKVVDAVIGMRVTPEEEEEGLDLTQHGEVGYNY
jgi:Amt family ammonium transporter